MNRNEPLDLYPIFFLKKEVKKLQYFANKVYLLTVLFTLRYIGVGSGFEIFQIAGSAGTLGFNWIEMKDH